MKFQQFSTFLLTILLTISCNAAPSLKDYGLLPTTSQVVISPNGERVAFRETTSDNDDIVAVFSIKDFKQISAVNVSKIDPGRIQFANNDNLLLTVSNHVDWRGFEKEFEAGTVFTVNIKTGKVEALIKLGESLGGRNSVYPGQLVGNIVGFNSKHTKIYIAAHVEKSYKNSASRINYSLLRTNVNGKGRPTIIDNGSELVINYFLDNSGKLIALEEHNSQTNKHRIKSNIEGKWKTIYEYKSEIRTHNFLGLSTDFKSIIYVRNDEDNLAYKQLSLADGKTTLVEGHAIENDVENIMVDDANVVIGVQYAGLFPTYKLFDPQRDKRFEEIREMLPGHAVTLTDWSEDWQHIVVKAEGEEFVSDYLLFSEGKAPIVLAKSRPTIPKESVNSTVTLSFRARDGLEIPTILTLPKTSVDNIQSLPTVLLPHGGPASYNQVGFDYKAQALASRGYLVVQPQFRGSSGFGLMHLEAGYGEWGKKMQHDLTDTVNFLVKKGYTDPNRVCIAGGSYGGYAALVGAALTPDIYRCAYSMAGVSDLHKMLLSDKKRYGKNSEILPYFTRSILNEDYDKKALNAVSPYYHIDKIKIPIMLVHGEDDTVVEYNQSKKMYKALKKAGKEVELIKLKDEDHYLQEGSTRLQALEALIGFIDKHIGDDAD